MKLFSGTPTGYRRAAALVATLVCAMALAQTPPPKKKPPAPAPQAVLPASTVEKSATLSRIAKNGVIRVGYIPTPGTFAFQDAQGNTVGYSIDICMKVIESFRNSLSKPDLQVAFRPLQAAERIPLLKAGEIDIECGGNTNTYGRQKEVDFTYTFFTTGLRLLARKPLKIEKTADLWKKRIAVSKGTTAETIMMRLKDEQRVQVVQVATDPEGLQLVESGQVDAFGQDDILLYGLAAESKMRSQLVVTGPFMTVEPYSFMLPKDDAAFREIVDKTVLSLMTTGEIMPLYRKWFDTDRLRVPLSVYMKENLKFPNKYGIP